MGDDEHLGGRQNVGESGPAVNAATSKSRSASAAAASAYEEPKGCSG